MLLDGRQPSGNGVAYPGILRKIGSLSKGWRMRSSGSGQRAIGYLTVCQDERLRFWGGLLLIDRVGRPLEFHSTVPVTASRAHTILYGPALTAHVYGELIAPALLQKVKVRPLAVLTDCPEVLPARHHSQYPLVCVCDRQDHPSVRDLAGSDPPMKGCVTPGTGMAASGAPEPRKPGTGMASPASPTPGTGIVSAGTGAAGIGACPGFGAGTGMAGHRGDCSRQQEGVRRGSGHSQQRGWHEDIPVCGVRSRVLAGYESDAEVLGQIWPSFGGHVDLMEPFVRIREALSEAQQAA